MGCAESDVKLPAKVIRIALVGERGSGKSSLISAFFMRKFESAYTPTISSNIGVKAYTFRDSPVVTTVEVWELNDPKTLPPNFNFVVLTLDVTLSATDMNFIMNSYITKLGLQRKLSNFAVAITKIDSALEDPERLKILIKKTLVVNAATRVYLTSAESVYGIDEMFMDVIKPAASERVSRTTSMADSSA